MYEFESYLNEHSINPYRYILYQAFHVHHDTYSLSLNEK